MLYYKSKYSSMCSFQTILGFGNPLVDCSVFLENTSLLKKYNLKEDGQKEVLKNEMNSLSKEIDGLKKYISPGGCCQNSFRVLQWFSNKKHDVYIFGSVGDDTEADFLKRTLELEGVKTRFVVQKNLATGKTIALVNGPFRSLVAHIGAAEYFPVESLTNSNDFMTLFDKSHSIFIEAYFLSNREITARYLVDLAVAKQKIILFNLCGEYIFHVVPKTIRYVAENSDVIFGNKEEFEALRILMNHDNLEEMLSKLLDTFQNKLGCKKFFVITDGPNPIRCYYGGEKSLKFHSFKIGNAEIKDTTGAGDAFAGGFLAGFCMEMDIQECIKMGIYCAHSIMKEVGCSLPSYEPFY